MRIGIFTLFMFLAEGSIKFFFFMKDIDRIKMIVLSVYTYLSMGEEREMCF